MKTIGERLKWARDQKSWSQAQLAAAAGVSQGTIGNIESGARQNPRELLAIAKAAGVTPEWLKSGKGSAQAAPPKSDVDREAIPVRGLRPVWVVGSTQGGLPERIWTDGDYPVGATDEYAELATNDPCAFLCRVVGDSMVPRYMPGEFALVEPGVHPELEDDVLVRLATGETMLKRLLSRRGGLRLGSYNGHEVLTYREEEVSWVYYVAHPVPARRMKQHIDLPTYQGPDRRQHEGPHQEERRHQPWHYGGGMSWFDNLDEVPEPKPEPKRRSGGGQS